MKPGIFFGTVFRKKKIWGCHFQNGNVKSSMDMILHETDITAEYYIIKQPFKVSANCSKNMQKVGKIFIQENLLKLGKNKESVALES